jgi:hypothetical protein
MEYLFFDHPSATLLVFSGMGTPISNHKILLAEQQFNQPFLWKSS